MTTVSHPPETNSNVVTSWIPLTSSFTPDPSCATGGIYSQLGGDGALALAFDPFYGINIDKSLTCLPPSATLWWTQSATVPLLTHTSLGPFACPGDYTTASTSAVNDFSTFVACCPSKYVFAGTKDSGTVGQCNSPLSVGQVMTYVDLHSFSTTSVTIANPRGSVYAVHVNGYAFAPSSTTTSTSSTTSSLPTSPISSTASSTGSAFSATSSPPGPSSTVVKGSLSTGARAGIGIGVSLAILGLCGLLVSFILIRRHRKRRVLPAVLHQPEQQIGYAESYPIYEIGGTPKEQASRYK